MKGKEKNEENERQGKGRRREKEREREKIRPAEAKRNNVNKSIRPHGTDLSHDMPFGMLQKKRSGKHRRFRDRGICPGFPSTSQKSGWSKCFLISFWGLFYSFLVCTTTSLAPL